MNEQISNSFKKEVEEFKKWSDNGSARINDSKSGFSPRLRYETPMNLRIAALKNIIDNTFNNAFCRTK